jgi:hypothetical protein
VLSRLFRRLFLEKLAAAHQAGALEFFGTHAQLAKPKEFAALLAPLRKVEWVVYSKRPFGGPQAVLAYLSRYTHRVAISNRRLIFIHVLPTGFHRIRHYGLFASRKRAENIARTRELLDSPTPQTQATNPEATHADEPAALSHCCSCCGGRMITIEIFHRGATPRYHPTAPTTLIIDTSRTRSQRHRQPRASRTGRGRLP